VITLVRALTRIVVIHHFNDDAASVATLAF
jgi:hypothetical protein